MTRYFLIKSNTEDIIISSKNTLTYITKIFKNSGTKFNSIIELSPAQFFNVIENNSCLLVSIN